MKRNRHKSPQNASVSEDDQRDLFDDETPPANAREREQDDFPDDDKHNRTVERLMRVFDFQDAIGEDSWNALFAADPAYCHRMLRGEERIPREVLSKAERKRLRRAKHEWKAFFRWWRTVSEQERKALTDEQKGKGRSGIHQRGKSEPQKLQRFYAN